MAELVNDELNIETVSDYFDLSHVPFKPNEIFDRPMLGDCCNNMCSGSICYTGTLYLIRDDHCNKCCFHLVAPDSCNEHSACTCYANDQGSDNRFLAINISREEYIKNKKMRE